MFDKFWGKPGSLMMGFLLFGYVQVGQIYQKFECKDWSDGGIVRNVVRWSIDNLLEVSFFTGVVSLTCTLSWGVFLFFLS